MYSNDYMFHETKDGSVVRRCFGIEWLTGCASDQLDGLTHLTASSSVVVPIGTSRDQMKRKSKEAWIHLRHVVPGIACRSFKCADKEGHYALQYVVPRSKEDIEDWTSKTVFFSDTIKTLEESHVELKDGHWWPQSADRHVMELHVSPLSSVDEWHFSLSAVHSSADGRSIFQILELYLDCLTSVLSHDGDTVASLVWGKEVDRLSPPTSFVSSIVSTGAPPSLVSDTAQMTNETPTPAPQGLWMYPLIATDKVGDLTRTVKFSAEDTKKLHAAAKLNGRTITQLVTALTVVAYAEAAFKTANEVGEGRFREVLSSYENATCYPIVLNFINQRHRLPGGYDSFSSPTCSPLAAFTGVPLFVSLEGVKKLLEVNEGKRSVSRVIDLGVFWDSLVREVANDWANVATSLEAYHKHDLDMHEGLEREGFKPEIFHGPVGIVSSVGDLSRLGILNKYLPSSSQSEKLTVTNLLLGIRVRVSSFANLLHQFNGELTCNFLTASEYTTSEAFRLTVDAFEEWSRTVIQ